jgi:hypothetical protein
MRLLKVITQIRSVNLNVHGMKIKKRSCGPSKANLKFTIGARNYKNYTAIGGRSALDLRAEVGVVHGGVTGFPLGPIVRFKPFKFVVPLITLRAMQGRHSRPTSSPRFHQISACVQCQWHHFVFLPWFSFHKRLSRKALFLTKRSRDASARTQQRSLSWDFQKHKEHFLIRY